MKKKFVILTLYLVLFQCFVVAKTPLRFVFFTDLHITNLSPGPSADLQKVISEVNATSGLDFVLVGGDIANFGDTISLRMAKTALSTLKIPYYIVPGNHDFQWNVGVGPKNFVKVFGDDKFAFMHKGYLFAGFATAPKEKGVNGYIQPADIAWLKSQLEKAGGKTPSFIITHYPLLPGDVDNGKELTDMLKGFDVKAVLNGHYHRNTVLNFDGVPGIVNRTVMQKKDAPAAYTIYTVDDQIHVAEKRIGEPEEIWAELPLEK